MSLVEEPVGDKPKPVCFGDSIALYCDEMVRGRKDLLLG